MLIIALFCGAACSAPQNDVLRREVTFEKRSVQMNSQASKVKLADKIDPIKHFLIGFDNNYIYFGEFEDGFRIIPYNIEKEQLEEPVYENDEEVTISYSDIINNKNVLIILEMKQLFLNTRLIKCQVSMLMMTIFQLITQVKKGIKIHLSWI